MSSTPLCGLCNQPMPKGEEMFHYHGYSGPCPTRGTEAEAQAKAAELRNMQAAADAPHSKAMATETRPPQHEHPEACPVCDSPYCEHDEAEQNLIKKAWESGYAARAAAPVEPPIDECWHEDADGFCGAPKAKHRTGNSDYEHDFVADEPVHRRAAATELLEPAPRPQDDADSVYKWNVICVRMGLDPHNVCVNQVLVAARSENESLRDKLVSDFLKTIPAMPQWPHAGEYKWKEDQYKALCRLNNYYPAATSSPVARPQEPCVNCGKVTNNKHCAVNNGLHVYEPAARVEHPTPPRLICPVCNLHCVNLRQYWTHEHRAIAPAAPVVEQRELMSVVEFYMKNRPTILMGWSINCDKAIVRMMESYLEYRLNEILERAASQRTEGEGQPK